MMPNRKLFWNIPSSLKYFVYICTCIVMMQTYCSIAFEITTSNKESKQNMDRAEPVLA